MNWKDLYISSFVDSPTNIDVNELLEALHAWCYDMKKHCSKFEAGRIMNRFNVIETSQLIEIPLNRVKYELDTDLNTVKFYIMIDKLKSQRHAIISKRKKHISLCLYLNEKEIYGEFKFGLLDVSVIDKVMEYLLIIP